MAHYHLTMDQNFSGHKFIYFNEILHRSPIGTFDIKAEMLLLSRRKKQGLVECICKERALRKEVLKNAF